MLSYPDKRDFRRMAMNSPASFQIEGESSSYPATVKDLSGSGLLLWSDVEAALGSTLLIEVLPGSQITPPLRAKVEVARCEPLSEEEAAAYSIACTITQVYEADQAENDVD